MIERRYEQHGRTSYIVRAANGDYVTSLTFREVMALVAAANGRIRARWVNQYSAWYRDCHLRPECDDYGVGWGTISGLQGAFRRPPYIQPCGADEGLGLTRAGRKLLDELLELDGTVLVARGVAA